ncbi:transcriptional Sir2 family isoform B [Chlorella sorokiniana]|uniref:Transcriptional Sir2 family isoform B n=1 Tax=Chlorella sorokiniana TaxID=3076 RepID=A0A2P6TM27_CHLSO|nr:transcriptional Sir2 family isoform B [Chlorella sorokiniana]|eukprot:PRW45382.1 transcriptional Sir2 family isoform B [Chlorella sorokiniana]
MAAVRRRAAGRAGQKERQQKRKMAGWPVGQAAVAVMWKFLVAREMRAPLLPSFNLQGVAELIRSGCARRIICMCGAGISVSAGIPDFRSPGTGLYHRLEDYGLPHPEAVFELEYFKANPRPFFLLAKELFPGVWRPTPAHYFMRLLHTKGLLLRCYTQNIDSLEHQAGLPRSAVIAAHGNFDSAHCTRCGRRHSVEHVRRAVFAREGHPCFCKRKRCGGLVKPDIVFFGENLPRRFFESVPRDFPQADLLIVMGSSLVVHPFASLIDEVDEDTPRLLVNREAAGEGHPLLRALSLQTGGFCFEAGENYRDAFFQGDCDDGVRQLCRLLGWESELEALIAAGPCPPSPEPSEAGGSSEEASSSSDSEGEGAQELHTHRHRLSRAQRRRHLRVAVGTMLALPGRRARRLLQIRLLHAHAHQQRRRLRRLVRQMRRLQLQEGGAQGGSIGGVANGSAEAAGTGTDGCAMPSSGTLSRAISSGALPDTLPHGMAVSSSSGALPDTLPHGMAVSSSSGGGSSMPPCSGGSSTGAAASGVAEPQAAGNSCLVIHNLSPYVMAWQVVEFFSQFGEVVECTKRPGATLAFVRFAQAAQAARAKEAVHYRMVPHMGQREPLSIQYRKQQPGRSGGSVPLASRSRTGGLPPLSGCSRGSSGSEVGGRESGGSEAGGSEGDCSGDSGAEGRAQVLPATPQYLSGGRALVVKNLPLSLPYEAVRVFFSQFGKLTSCYKQTQAPFAFVTYSQPEAAAAALRSVNGMLCPDLNVASLIRVEYRRGASTRHTSSSSAAAITGVSTHADRAPTQPGSSDGSSLSSRSESVHSESTAFNECCESSIRAYRGGGGGSHASLAFHSGSGDLDAAGLPVLAVARPKRDAMPAKAAKKETQLNSSLAPMAALAAVNPLADFLQGQADYFSTLNLPQWLVQWGHPGNMAVVLIAMGMYGCGYLGWRIRLSEDAGEVAVAQDLHPKLAIGMTIFFALGALGGSMSLLMQGKDMWTSTHFVTGVTGLVLLGLQGMLSAFFEDDPNARGLHAYFGTAILALFVWHGALGLQLGLSL